MKKILKFLLITIIVLLCIIGLVKLFSKSNKKTTELGRNQVVNVRPKEKIKLTEETKEEKIEEEVTEEQKEEIKEEVKEEEPTQEETAPIKEPIKSSVISLPTEQEQVPVKANEEIATNQSIIEYEEPYYQNNNTNNDYSYSDAIYGDRCYGNSLYYITVCQTRETPNAQCKYTKINGVNTSGSVTRSELKMAVSCQKKTNNRVTSSTVETTAEKKTTNTEIADGRVIGSTAFSALNNKLYLKEEANVNSKSIVIIGTGEPFKILETINDNWWKVEYKNNVGYVDNTYCMINLPDFIPSIEYNIMDTKENIYTASGVKLSIYGKKLYKTGKVYNSRLEREEYIVPITYSFAKKILKAQNLANQQGYNLKIYDGYRPKSVADELRDSLASLYNSNSTVKKGIDYSYEKNGKTTTWGPSWFIAQNLSAHSVGAAIDVVLTDKETKKELPAQSSIHDLSTASVKYSTAIKGQTTVREDLYSIHANKHTKDLDRIMLESGMTNLASEWWHFQDNETYKTIKELEPKGLDFQPNSIVSIK